MPSRPCPYDLRELRFYKILFMKWLFYYNFKLRRKVNAALLLRILNLHGIQKEGRINTQFRFGYKQFKAESGKCVNKAKKETSSDSEHVLLRNMNTLTNFNTHQKRYTQRKKCESVCSILFHYPARKWPRFIGKVK